MNSAALYRCTACSALRQYGHAKPEYSYLPLLFCRDCKHLTRHEFHQIVVDEANSAYRWN